MKIFSVLAILFTIVTKTVAIGGGAIKLSFDKSYGTSYEDASRERGELEGEFGADLGNQETYYSVLLEVGSPAQNVTVLLDTGSSDMWVIGSNNPYCKSVHKRDDLSSLMSLLSELNSIMSAVANQSGNDIASQSVMQSGSGSGTGSASSPTPAATMDCSTGTFNSNKSTTFKSNGTYFDIIYGDYSFAAGVWGTDRIGLGGINVTGVSFAVANETNSSVGILGLGLPEDETTYTPVSTNTTARTYEYINFPALLKRQGLIHRTAYSLYLNSSGASSGEILFGAVDHAKYSGTLYTVPLLNPDSKTDPHPYEFDVTLQGVGFTNGSSKTTFTTTPMPALLDSGTTLMYLPYALVDKVASTLGGEYNDNTGYYMIPCPPDDDESKLVFDFGGFNIATNLSNYMLGTADTSGSIQCALGILPSDDLTILGDVFLMEAYVVYDLDSYEVSLAQASYDNSTEDIEIITSTVPGATKAPGYSRTWSGQTSISTGGDIFSTTTKSSGTKRSTTTSKSH